jgi:DNA topoisomerase-1
MVQRDLDIAVFNRILHTKWRNAALVSVRAKTFSGRNPGRISVFCAGYLSYGRALIVGCEEMGTAVDLVYVSDKMPGITRRRNGKGFSYWRPDGMRVTAAERQRIDKLAIPPAYREVWICALENGHIQATGLDAKGRKQYRYHPDWTTAQSETKFARLSSFGAALPALRRRLRRDLQSSVGDLTFSLAALVMLLDRTLLRVGNTEYAATNRSYGASTLLSRHLRVKDGVVRLSFVAKGGKRVQRTLNDRRLNRILQAIGDLPGRNLFTYLDENGAVRSLDSHSVNAYLANVAGPGVTAKSFRTWGGTLAAFEAARATSTESRVNVASMAKAAAERLDNTPTVCRKSYIHPSVINLSDLAGPEREKILSGVAPDDLPEMRAAERHLLAFLRHQEG